MVDGSGNLRRRIMPDGTINTMFYDANHRMTTFIDADGQRDERIAARFFVERADAVRAATRDGPFWIHESHEFHESARLSSSHRHR